MTKKAMDARRAALKLFVADAYGAATVFLDGPEFDGGIVGVTAGGRLVYSYGKLVNALAEANGWDETDAVDWIEFNTLRSLPYMGDVAPIVMDDLDASDFAPPENFRKKPLDPEHGDVVQYGATT